MSKSPAEPKPAQNRRASPEAVAKRRAARAFNEAVRGPEARGPDGRTERRRRRLLQEFAGGRTSTGQALKPIDVLLRAQALLDLGETLAKLVEARTPPAPVPTTDDLVARVRALHEAYSLAPEVYRFVGIDDAALALAGIERPKPGPVKAAPRPSVKAAPRPSVKAAPRPSSPARRGAA